MVRRRAPRISSLSLFVTTYFVASCGLISKTKQSSNESQFVGNNPIYVSNSDPNSQDVVLKKADNDEYFKELVEQERKERIAADARLEEMIAKLEKDLDDFKNKVNGEIEELKITDEELKILIQDQGNKFELELQKIETSLEQDLATLDEDLRGKIVADFKELKQDITLLSSDVSEQNIKLESDLEKLELDLDLKRTEAIEALEAKYDPQIAELNTKVFDNSQKIDQVSSDMVKKEADLIELIAAGDKAVKEELLQKEMELIELISSGDQQLQNKIDQNFINLQAIISENDLELKNNLIEQRKELKRLIEQGDASLSEQIKNLDLEIKADIMEEVNALIADNNQQASEELKQKLSKLASDTEALVNEKYIELKASDSDLLAEINSKELSIKEYVDQKVTLLSDEDKAIKATLSGELDSLKIEITATQESTKKAESDLAQLSKDFHDSQSDIYTALEATKKYLEDKITVVAEALKNEAAQLYATKEDLESVQKSVTLLKNATNILAADVLELEANVETIFEKTFALEVLATDNKDAIAAQNEVIRKFKEELASKIDGISAELEALASGSNQDALSKIDLVLNRYIEDMVAMQVELRADLGQNQSGETVTALIEHSMKFQIITGSYKSEISDSIAIISAKTGLSKEQSLELDELKAKFSEGMAKEQKIRTDLNRLTILASERLNKIELVAMDNKDLLEKSSERIEELKLFEQDMEQKYKDQQGELKAIKDSVAALDQQYMDLKLLALENAAEIVRLDGNSAALEENFKQITNELIEAKSKQSALEAEFSLSEKEKQQKDKVLSSMNQLLVSINALKFQVFLSLEPNQEKLDFYDQYFLTAMIGKEQVCDVNKEASFANALGRDSFQFLMNEYVFALVFGIRSASQEDQMFFGFNSISEGLSELQRKVLVSLLSIKLPTQDPSCLTIIKKWSEETLFSGQKLSSEKTIGKALNNQEMLRLATQVKSNIEQTRQDYKDLEVMVAAKGDDDSVAAHVVKLIESLHVSVVIEEYTANYNTIIQNNITLQKGVDGNSDDIAEFDVKLTALEESMKNIDDWINKNPQEKLAELEGKVGTIEASLKETITVLSKLTQRLGYPDLTHAVHNAGDIIGLARVTDDTTPSIAQIQHFFEDGLYEESEKIGASKGWNAWNKRLHDSRGFNKTCQSEYLGFGGGSHDRQGWGQNDANALFTGGWDTCWVNFRTFASKQHVGAVNKVMFRVLGKNISAIRMRSAQLGNVDKTAILELDRFSEVRDAYATYRMEKDNVRSSTTSFDQDHKDYISEYMLPETVSFKDNKGKQITYKSRIWGNNSMGAFDIYAGSILHHGASKSFWGTKVQFQPIHAKINNDITDEENFGSWTFKESDTWTEHFLKLYSPLVIDFVSVAMPKTVSQLGGKRFDLDATGEAEQTGWIMGNEASFLALDLNGNGKIDNGRELFGQATKLADGSEAANGYIALAQYDDNKDGAIDSRDAIFDKLVVWSDNNGNARSEVAELSSVTKMGITSISVDYDEVAKSKQIDQGNMIKYKAKVIGPESCPNRVCNSYDVFFGTTKNISRTY